MISQSVFCPWGHWCQEFSCYTCAPSPYLVTKNHRALNQGSVEATAMVHCDLSIDLEMCGRDKHEQWGQNAAVRHPVGNTPPIRSVVEVHQWCTAAPSVSRRLTSLLGCQKSRVQLHQQQSQRTTHSPLGSHVHVPKWLVDFLYPRRWCYVS